MDKTVPPGAAMLLEFIYRTDAGSAPPDCSPEPTSRANHSHGLGELSPVGPVAPTLTKSAPPPHPGRLPFQRLRDWLSPRPLPALFAEGNRHDPATQRPWALIAGNVLETVIGRVFVKMAVDPNLA